ncbi:aspartate aminotransferase family protein [Nocardiopsis ansamitocini]|uniref:(S)-3-amino-2-methylpropionate transaminase n=1 Tax=Nocardiopsis ansamitocini TaxID=1670832 RepID=A0A9W6UKM7_9ACTN|nr:aminotransferase class III-fold pyridoxal phosphate-dependent enzyme [Nocardiopsis ansamitocini]GLU49773.1 aspartate aminotransferase family protein [Nocardiopsis ansamitocini]
MSDPSLAERADAVLPPTASRVTRLGITRAEGSYVWSETGRRYLDLTCGVGVTNVGHNHPGVMSRVREQLDSLVHAGHNVSYYPSYVELAERLVAAVPGRYRAYFSNSGAEAVESALKMCMRATGRGGLIAFRRGFHGRTLGTTSLSTSSAKYRIGYGEALPSVQHLPFPYAFRSGRTEAEEVRECLRAFDEHLQLVTDPSQVAAVVVEPVQGEGGYLPAPVEFLRELARRCSELDIPLVLDEIQTGFGRTGRLFAYEHYGITPDVLVLAKGIANGMPLSAVVAREDLMLEWPPGAHGGTYGGNPVSCAAALAVLDLLDEPLLARARQVGDRLLEELRTILEAYPGVVDVRGTGLMIGVEFLDGSGVPDHETVALLRAHAESEGLLLLPCGPDRNVIRLIPPLTVSDDELAFALSVFRSGVESVLASDISARF